MGGRCTHPQEGVLRLCELAQRGAVVGTVVGGDLRAVSGTRVQAAPNDAKTGLFLQ